MAPPDPKSTFFFYGTLMTPPVLSRVLFGASAPDPHSTTFRKLPTPVPALLQNYQRSRVRRADYPAILPKSGASVRGMVVTDLNAGDTWRLDVFEGKEYERRIVKIQILGDNDEVEEEIEAQTYVWIAGEQRLENREWDFENFVKDKLWRWSGAVSESEGEYSELDEAVRSGELDEESKDPTGGRHVNGGTITDELKSEDLEKYGDRTNAWIRSFNE